MLKQTITVDGEVSTTAGRIRLGRIWDGAVVIDRGSNPEGEIVVEVSDGDTLVAVLLTKGQTMDLHDWLDDKVALWESPTFEVKLPDSRLVTLPRSKGPRAIVVGALILDGQVGLGVNRDGSVSIAAGDGHSIVEAQISKDQARELEGWFAILVADWGI